MGVPNSAWTLTDINESYEVCDTYPPLLAVPAAASTAVLVGCSRFRSKGRLPVLSYRHHNQVRGEGGAANCSATDTTTW